MRNISLNVRRATQYIDLDFIRYSISDDSIESFINKLYLENGIHILLEKPIVELKHKDVFDISTEEVSKKLRQLKLGMLYFVY